MDKYQPTRLADLDVSADAELLLYFGMLAGYPVDNYAKFLRTCPQDIMEMLHYSFMIEGDAPTLYHVSRCLIISKEKILVVTGTLDLWFSTIIRGLNKPNESNLIFNQLYAAFCRRGLNLIFDNYRKVVNKDTFLLEKK